MSLVQSSLSSPAITTTDKLNGQWLGRYAGLGAGRIILNVDERDKAYEGVAYLLPDDFKTFPASAASFRTTDKQTAHFQFRTTSVMPINPVSLFVEPWDLVKSHFGDNVAFSSYANVTGSVDGEFLKLYRACDFYWRRCAYRRSFSGRPAHNPAPQPTFQHCEAL
jgi:hypothetical protein